jgi:hypothetical protein
MKKIILPLLITLLFSCKKDSNSTSSTSASISSPFTVKYEVLPSAVVTTSFGFPNIFYVNSTGQPETASLASLSVAIPWSKTITITTTTRPLQLNLQAAASNPSYYLVLDKSGTITQNLYINGSLKATSTNQSEITPTASYSKFKINNPALTFTVN